MNEEYSLILENISKNFQVDRGIAGKHGKGFLALKDINLKIRKGECFGIIGPNGSGKTTLLKLIGGIIEKTHGSLYTKGKILSFIDAGSGFHEELTGKENIYLFGSILGMKRSEIKKRYRSIVNFAQLDDFINFKLKEYSNGMKMRLAYAVAMANDPDIVLIDEIIAVGDHEFQKKSTNRIKLMKDAGKTIVLVSHDMSMVRELCDRAILLDKGRIISEGIPQKVILKYHEIGKRNTLSTLKRQVQKNLRRLEKIYQDIASMKKKRKEKGILAQIKNISADMRLRKAVRAREIIKGEILDTISDMTNKATNFLPVFWSRYNDIMKNSADIEKTLDDLEQFLYCIKVKYDSFDMGFADIVLYLNLLRIRFVLDEKEDTLSNLLDVYMSFFRSDSEIHKKRKLLVDMKSIISDLSIYKVNSKMLIRSVDMYKEALKIGRIGDKDYIDNKIEDMIYRYVMEINDEITLLKIYPGQDIEEKKSKLEFLIKYRRALFSRYETNKDKARPKKVRITDVALLDKDNKVQNIFRTNQDIKIKIDYMAQEKIMDPVFGIAIHNIEGAHITGPNTGLSDITIPYIHGKGSISYIMEDVPLLEGIYLLSVSIHPNNTLDPYDYHHKRYSFEIKNSSDEKRVGLVNIRSRWETDV